MNKKQQIPGLFTEEGLAFLWNYLLAHQNVPERFSLDQHAVGFLAHCLKHFTRSKSNLLQDLYVAYKLREKKQGYFVEFGAMDGILMSNTLTLETDLGWEGILAEPYPAWREALRSNRRANTDHRCVWRESGKRLEFLAANRHPELSSLRSFANDDLHAHARSLDAEVVMVDTVSLNDLLHQHGAPAAIDYLSVDTEGSELEILEAFDFERHRVSIITVEHNYKSDTREALHRLLAGHGFVREFELFSKADDWYFHPARVAG